jgi:hypothetical protein
MDTKKSLGIGAIIGIIAAVLAVIGGIYYMTVAREGGDAGTGKQVTREEELKHVGGKPSPEQIGQSYQKQYQNARPGGPPAGYGGRR